MPEAVRSNRTANRYIVRYFSKGSEGHVQHSYSRAETCQRRNSAKILLFWSHRQQKNLFLFHSPAALLPFSYFLLPKQRESRDLEGHSTAIAYHWNRRRNSAAVVSAKHRPSSIWRSSIACIFMSLYYSLPWLNIPLKNSRLANSTNTRQSCEFKALPGEVTCSPLPYAAAIPAANLNAVFMVVVQNLQALFVIAV